MNPDRAARLHGAVDRDRGEAFCLEPRVPSGGGRMRPAPDPDRAPVDFVGVWAAAPTVAAYEANRAHAVSRGQKPGHQSQEVAVLVREALLPADIRADDVVLRVATDERFGVTRIAPTGSMRLVLILHR